MRALCLQLVIVVLLVPMLRAQEQVQGETPQQEAPASVPAFLLGESMPYIVPATENRNLVISGMTFSASLDDNALGWGTSDIQFYVTPSVEVQRTSSKWQGSISYRPGASFSQHGLRQNQYSHYLGGNFAYQFGPRLQVSVRQEYDISNDPLDSVSGNQFMSPVAGPSAAAVLPESKRTTILSNADIYYRLSARTTVGVTGSFNSLDYGGNSPSVVSEQSMATRSTSGGAFYAHQLSARRTAGVKYEYTDIRQDMYSTHARVNRLILFHQFTSATKGSITLYAGPGYTKSESVVLNGPMDNTMSPILTSDLSPVVGATYTWAGRRNGLQLEYTRGVSQGGGIVTVARTNSGTARLYRQLTSSLAVRTDIVAVDYNSLDRGVFASQLRTITAGLSLERRIGDVSVSLRYARAWQNGTGTGASLGNHNLVQLSMVYQFRQPLGR